MAKRENKNVVYLPSTAIRQAVKKYETPFFLYEEAKIRTNLTTFRETFRQYFPGFKPLYAVKANTNPELLKIIYREGFGADASSEAEAWVTKQLKGWGMYTGNYTRPDEFRFAMDCGFDINLDDISMLKTLKKVGMPEFISFRINPGISKGGMKSLFFAGPDAKYGVPAEQVVEAYRTAKRMGVKRFGMHTMTGSNVLDERYFPTVVEKLLDLGGRLKQELGIDLECINIGGGFGVPYRPEEKSLDLEKVAKSIRRVFNRKLKEHGMVEPTLMAEPGRWIMADTGWLIGTVHVIKDGYKKFAGIDAGMNDLPRPAIYDAYHHVSVLGKSLKGKKETVSIVGRLCENNDQFAKDRKLPPVKIGDTIVIHNAGAHAYAMGHNYNNRLRSAEYLYTTKGTFKKIRRAETIEDLFATTTLKTRG
ncbi:MAG: diaminopimelate decarboxylase [Planctomycetota bacterium]|jgi:diaminopimelate decarboxylase